MSGNLYLRQGVPRQTKHFNMTPPIELVPEFIKMCDAKMAALRMEMESLMTKHQELEEKLTSFARYRFSLEHPDKEVQMVHNTAIKPPVFSDGFGYNVDAPLSEKVRFILHEADRPMRTSEVVSRMMELEPAKYDRRQYMKRVSSYLADAVNAGKLSRRREAGQESLHWLPINGQAVNEVLNEQESEVDDDLPF